MTDPQLQQRVQHLEAIVMALADRVDDLMKRRGFTDVEAARALDRFAHARALLPGQAVNFLVREVVAAGALPAESGGAFGQQLGKAWRAALDAQKPAAQFGPYEVIRLADAGNSGVLWQLRRPW